MANEVKWKGGATAVAQVETFTLNNDFADDETALTMTITAEDGSTTQTVAVDPDGVDESVIAAAWHTALNASTQTLFTPITWTVLANVVTGTAKTAGIPFYAESSVTGTGTVTDNESTSSAGPHDWNTATNWDTGAKPVAEDHVKVQDGSYDIRYGLDQSSVDIDDLKVGPGYTGSIGDSVNGYYLRIDINHASAVPGNGERSLVLNSGGKATWIQGEMPNVFVLGATGGNHAVELKPEDPTGTCKIVVTGNNVRGTVRVADSSYLDQMYVLNAPQAKVYVGTSITGLDLVEMNSGWVYCETAFAASGILKVAGGTFTEDYYTGTPADVVVTNIHQRGGTINWNANGTIGIAVSDDGLSLFGGLFDLRKNEQSTLSMFQTEVFGGTFTDKGSACTVNYNSGFHAWGGDYTAANAGDVPWGA